MGTAAAGPEGKAAAGPAVGDTAGPGWRRRREVPPGRAWGTRIPDGRGKATRTWVCVCYLDNRKQSKHT